MGAPPAGSPKAQLACAGAQRRVRKETCIEPEYVRKSGERSGYVEIMVTRIAGDGRLLHRLVDTATRSDAGRWESLLRDAALADPPPYQAAPDAPVYLINTGEQPVLVAQDRLTGPMEELVSAVLAEGDPVQRQASQGHEL